MFKTKKFNIIKKVFILAVLWLVSITALANTQVLDLFYANTRSMQADFEQTISERFGKVLEQSSGKLIIQRPHQFVLHYQQPDQQHYVSDGKTLWIYDMELEQVTIKNFEGGLAASPALLISSNNNIHQSYQVSLAHDPERPELAVFKLVPKQEESMFSLVYLIFNQGQLVELNMHDNFEQVTRLKFSNIQINKKIPLSTFSFEIPEDVDVIGTVDNSEL